MPDAPQVHPQGAPSQILHVYWLFVDRENPEPESTLTTTTVTIVTVNYAPEETGIAVYTTSLAEGLAEMGVRVNVITAAPHYPAWRVAPIGTWAAHEIRNGVAVQRLRSYVPEKPGKVKRLLFEVLHGLRFATSPHAQRMLRESNLVILASPALMTSALVRWAMPRRRSRTHTAMWVQDRYGAGIREIHGGNDSLPNRFIEGVERWLAQSCDSVIVIHDRWADDCLRDWDLSPGRVQVIRNWSNLPEATEVDAASTRHYLGWGRQGEEIVVLHAGNMGAKQDLGNVISAAKLAEHEGLPVRFVLLGDGNQREALQADAGACSHVQFLQHLPGDLFGEALASADILLVNEVAGMRSTAVPSKLTSYFTAGRPVLAATDAGSVTAEEVRSSGVGVVIPPSDPAELLRACLRIPEGPLAFPGSQGTRYVEERLSRASAIARFVTLQQSLASNTGDPSDVQSADEVKKDPA